MILLAKSSDGGLAISIQPSQPNEIPARIDWKYALGLELTDPGFDFSVLSAFRGRLIAGQREQELLDILLETLKQKQLLKALGRQRTDSTHVLAAIREVNRTEMIGEAMRHALNELADFQPDWLRPIVKEDWFARYAQRFDSIRFPKEPAARQKLIEAIATDGVVLLNAVRCAAESETLRQLPSVEILRRVWIQIHPMTLTHVTALSAAPSGSATKPL